MNRRKDIVAVSSLPVVKNVKGMFVILYCRFEFETCALCLKAVTNTPFNLKELKLSFLYYFEEFFKIRIAWCLDDTILKLELNDNR